ncbi:TldD/PmbA family protein [Heliobacterium undosum]|uniref:TldD/PmbA family protein n=1 Tax=Heliomicrobium undosum TaxID=121734 RepID=A0A845KZA2_9FIRM|nr:TldD/PmbA family protein [Heliomicrobium undosum]MZP28476.1 TldD/PmbA family protein [Heliomicrobium undosum]
MIHRPAVDDLRDVLQIALRQGADFADVFIEKKSVNGIGCEDNKIERINSGTDIGAGIRVIAGESTAYAYTNDLSLEGLSHAAKVASHAARGGAASRSIDLTRRTSPVDLVIESRPDQVAIEDKVEQVMRANRHARNIDDRIKQVTVGYGDVVQQVTIANSEGDYIEDERIRTRFVVHAVAADGAVIQTGYEALGGAKGFEIFKERDPEALAQAAVDRALLMLTAKPAPSGKMPVVMSSAAGGTMVHEACGHGLEADLVQKGLSVYAGKEGQAVASPLVTVIDDGTIAGKYGTLRFDDEGTPGQKNVLIEKGILKGFMHDRFTAGKDKRPPTGNGRRESYQHKPLPRMTNTLIASGDEIPEKIIKDTKRGLFVKKMGGGQVNTTNGDFVFDVAEGYLIENGEIAAAVRGATLTGNGPEVLRRIDRVGNDLGFAIGTCGKDGQGAPVSDAQPTLRITSLIVGGTGATERDDDDGQADVPVGAGGNSANGGGGAGGELRRLSASELLNNPNGRIRRL